MPSSSIYLNTDPKFFHTGPEALLAGYRDIAKRIDAELPRLFAQLPRAPYGVRSMPASRGRGCARSTTTGRALDGTRAGFFNANAQGWRTRPTWRMETLAAHEAVPGHHLQIARALELRRAAEFRRNGSYTAFVEGWALYAETLGFEIGLYEDPLQPLRPSAMAGVPRRAAGGRHRHPRHGLDAGSRRSTSWSSAPAWTAPFVSAEVDRYTSGPGQALAYMVGQLKITSCATVPRAALGERFDIRRFHTR